MEDKSSAVAESGSALHGAPSGSEPSGHKRLSDVPADLLANRVTTTLIMAKGNLNLYDQNLQHFIEMMRAEAAEDRADLLDALNVIADASERSETVFGGSMSEVTRVFQNITRVSRAAIASSASLTDAARSASPRRFEGQGPGPNSNSSISTTPPAPRKTTAMESHNHSEGEG